MRRKKFEKILSIATHLISRHGYKGTSLQEIADKAGLHKSSLFHYFKNKEELLLRILEKSIEEVNISLEKIIVAKDLKPEEKLKKAIDNHLTLLIRYHDNVNIYLNELGSLSSKNQTFYLMKRKKYEKDLEKIISEIKKKGHFRGLNTKIVTYGLLGMLNWVVKWYKENGALDKDEIAHNFYQMIIQGQGCKIVPRIRGIGAQEEMIHAG